MSHTAFPVPGAGLRPRPGDQTFSKRSPAASAGEDLPPKMRRWALLVLIFLTIVVPEGCAPRKALLLGEDFSSPERALTKLEQERTPTGTLQSLSTLGVTTADGRYRVKTALFAKRPFSLRIEEVPLFGLPDLYLTANRDHLRVFFPKEGRFYVGKPTGENISKFLPWGLAVDEFIALLFGMPPPRIAGAERLDGRAEDNLYRIDAFAGGRQIGSLWIDPPDHRLVRTQSLTEKGAVLYEATLNAYGPAGDLVIPKELSLNFPGHEKIEVYLRHEEVEIAPGVTEDLFDLETPAGITPLLLD